MDIATSTNTAPPVSAGIRRRPAGRLRGWAAAGLVGLLGLLSACGGGGGGGGDDGGGPPTGGGTEYFPMALGDRWISRDPATVGFITTRVTAVQTTGSTQNLTLTQFTVDGQRTEIQLRREAGGIYLLPSDDDPDYLRNLGPLLQMKLPVREGETYPQIALTAIDLGEDFDGDNRNETAEISSSITVVGLVPVTLPDIGTLNNVAQLRTTLTLTVRLSSTGETQTIVTTANDYYAPDIGPVKSEISVDGLGQLAFEEAVGYAVGTRRSETRAPVATQQTPVPGSTVAPNVLIEIFFDEELDAYDLELAPPVLRRADGFVPPGRFELTDGRRLTFFRKGEVPSGVYSVDLSGVKDAYGNVPNLAPWTFTFDGVAPQLLSSSLTNGATGVPLDVEILLTFSEPVVPEASAFTINTPGFSGGYSLTPVLASQDGRTIRLVRSVPLNYGSTYRLTVSPLLRDTVGNYLGSTVEIDFTTEAGRFAAAHPLPLASPIRSSAVAELTGDGRGDLLVATLFGNAPDTDYRVLLYPAQSDGSFATPRELPAAMSGTCPPYALATADVNADGRRDVLVWRGDCGVRLLQQADDGSFAVAWDDATLSMSQVADVNADGRPDLIAHLTGAVRIHLGQAGGGFGPATDVPVEGVRQIDVGDLNGDGRADIVGSGDNLVVIRSLAGGGFAAPEVLALGQGNESGGVIVGDINGDGRADLVYSLKTSTANDGLAWRLQQADGTLGFVETVRSPLRPSALKLADLNGDGRQDVVLGFDGLGQLLVYMQGSDGVLAPYEYYVVPEDVYLQPSELTVGDFSGDGRPDVLIGNTVLLQNTPASAGVRRSPLTVRTAAGTAAGTTASTTSSAGTTGTSAVLKATIEALKRRAPVSPGGR